jgi:cytosine/adenosine deaminase-related metal-dependent hydrolase
MPSPIKVEDTVERRRCYMCGRSANQICKLMGAESVEGYEFKTLYIKEGGGLTDSKVVVHRSVNLCDYERKAVNHRKIEVVVCPICKMLIGSLSLH